MIAARVYSGHLLEFLGLAGLALLVVGMLLIFRPSLRCRVFHQARWQPTRVRTAWCPKCCRERQAHPEWLDREIEGLAQRARNERLRAMREAADQLAQAKEARR